MTLKIQKFISCFDDIKEANKYLRLNLRIGSEECILYDAEGKKFTVYFYSPLQSADMLNPIVREAHGLALHEDGDLLTKLYNHPIKITKLSNTRLDHTEILPDGKLISVFNLEGKWRVATDKTVDGSENTIGYEFMNFVGGQHKFNTSHPDLIFVFCYISENNTDIIPSENKAVHLITVIDRTTGQECNRDLINGINLGFELKSFKPMPHNIAGTVIISEGEWYLFPNKLNIAVKNALIAGELVRPIHIAKIFQVCSSPQELDLVCMSFPYYERMLDLLEETFYELLTELNSLWPAAKIYILNDKRFAEIINHHPLKHILFKFKNGETNGIINELRKLKPSLLIKIAKDRHSERFKAYSKLISFEKGDNVANKNNKEKDNKEEGTIPYCQAGD